MLLRKERKKEKKFLPALQRGPIGELEYNKMRLPRRINLDNGNIAGPNCWTKSLNRVSYTKDFNRLTLRNLFVCLARETIESFYDLTFLSSVADVISISLICNGSNTIDRYW